MKTEDYQFVLNFAIKVILPVFLVILLFGLSYFAVIIPAFEQVVINSKKEMIKDLTDTAWSILAESEQKVIKGEWTRPQAQEEAIERIKDLRYGDQHKDYFWITDMHPKMIVHPYRPELNGQDLTNYTGHNNQRIFVKFADVVKNQESGYVRYYWQWKDKKDVIAEKLSYVKIFKPWDWIIGTGVYLKDVQDEIDAMEHRLKMVSLVIIVLIVFLLAFVAYHGMKTEKRKNETERALIDSREKYKMLVNASTEGLIMVLDQDYSYVNQIVLDMLKCSDIEEFRRLDVLRLTRGTQEEEGDELQTFMQDLQADDAAMDHVETRLPSTDGSSVNVFLAGSPIVVGNQKGMVIIVRDVSVDRQIQRRKLAEERENLIIELQTSLLFLNQPINKFMKEVVSCNMKSSIGRVAQLMKKRKCTAVLLTTDEEEFVGIVTNSDITERVMAEGSDSEQAAFSVMSSPITGVSENALIFEGAQVMQEKQIQHLAVRNTLGEVTGIISIKELLQVQEYSSATLIKEIEAAASFEEIVECHVRLPVIVKALIDSGAKPRNVTRLIATVSDLTLENIIRFAIIDMKAVPPVRFAFITLGSEGRQEETMITDQDNGIIYEDPVDQDPEEVRAYFLKLGQTICYWLDRAGYHYCIGKIMANNPDYCQPLKGWQNHFVDWITNATPRDLLDFNIFFDFRHAYGERALERSLRSHISDILRENQAFFIHLAQNCLLYKPPVNMFGNITLENRGDHAHTLNIKEALKPIINFARIYSLEHGIEATNTLQRLEMLYERGVVSESSYNDITEAYNYMMQLRFEHQAALISNNQEPDNHINPSELSSMELEMLKKVFAQISAIQSKLSFHFKGSA